MSKKIMGYEINEFYRSRIEQTIDLTLQDCPRVMVVRVDLRFPDYYPYYKYSKPYISRFFESLRERVRNDTKRKENLWNRSLNSNVDYAWVREVGYINEKNHYHVRECQIFCGRGGLTSFNSSPQ
ncbi:YagK/YfjJ domain-containing protein [Castellaniella sp.]|uniref:YagK/YfjJ domain-containing protein n=1 Tax=Castellaniella sp. TaxID=1955812 RepID=UPI003A8FFB2C